MVTESQRAYLIDASIYIFRYYFSPTMDVYSQHGRPTESVAGYTLWLLRFLKSVKPGYVGVCFDESLESCFRNDIYPEYKSSRVLPDDDLAFQLLACKEITELMGIAAYASPTYEADDLIGSLASYCNIHNLPLTVVTRDKDLGQLITLDSSIIWDFPKGPRMNRFDVEEKMGIKPEQIPDFLALVGDSVDDIPGVPGVGQKAAIQLLGEFKSWAEIKDNLEKVSELPIRGAKKLQGKLQEYRHDVDTFLKLTQVHTGAMKTSQVQLERQPADKEKLLLLVEALGFLQECEKLINEL